MQLSPLLAITTIIICRVHHSLKQDFVGLVAGSQTIYGDLRARSFQEYYAVFKFKYISVVWFENEI